MSHLLWEARSDFHFHLLLKGSFSKVTSRWRCLKQFSTVGEWTQDARCHRGIGFLSEALWSLSWLRNEKKPNGSYLSCFRSLSEFWGWFEVTGRFKEQLLSLAAWPGGDSSAEAGHRCSIRNEAGKYCRCVQFPHAADTNAAGTTISLCAAGASGSVQKQKVNTVTNVQRAEKTLGWSQSVPT